MHRTAHCSWHCLKEAPFCLCLQAAAQWVETSCPFLGLLLVVFFQQHFQGEAVCIPSNAAWGDCVVASTPQDALILAKPLQHKKPLLRFGCNMAF